MIMIPPVGQWDIEVQPLKINMESNTLRIQECPKFFGDFTCNQSYDLGILGFFDRINPREGLKDS